MSVGGEIFLHCDGEETLDALFRHDRHVKCELVLGGSDGGVEIANGDFAAARAGLLERARRAKWEEVKIPPLLPELEKLWETTGDRIGHLCPVCAATRRQAMETKSALARTAWDVWSPADVERRVRQIDAARTDASRGRSRG